jgi:integrase
VQYVHATIRKALNDAVRWGLLVRNPAHQAAAPTPRRGELRTWTANELRGFLESVRSDRLYAAWQLAALTGMRRGEVLGLRWADVDLDTGWLSVRQTVVMVDNQPQVSEPKTARGRRRIALDPDTIAALRAHHTTQAAERLAAGPAWQGRDLVFTGQDGAPLHPEYVRRRFDRHLHHAGLPRIRFHDLRHTHATLALQAGVHPKVVSERLGHTTVAMTLDIYSHAIPAMQQDAAVTVADLEGFGSCSDVGSQLGNAPLGERVGVSESASYPLPRRRDEGRLLHRPPSWRDWQLPRVKSAGSPCPACALNDPA